MTFKIERLPDGKPYRYSSVGCYPLVYVTGKDRVLCPPCAAAAEEDRDDPAVAGDANWEDPELYCDGCNTRIESAYAEAE